MLREPRSRAELQEFCNIGSRDYFRKKILNPLIDSKKIRLTKPDKPTSSNQRYVWNDN
jgi:ATP-dependent DNA helicase RecG